MLDVTTKRCAKCHQTKPLDQFYNNRARLDGKYPNCIECHCAYMRNRYKNPNVKQARSDYEKRRRTDPEYVEKVRRRGREFYASLEGRAKTLLKGAQRRDPNATVTLEHIEKGIKAGVCPMTGMPFDLSNASLKWSGRSNNPYAPSLDRINPKGGYTNENTRIVIWQYNWMKGGLSDEEIKFICSLIVNKK